MTVPPQSIFAARFSPARRLHGQIGGLLAPEHTAGVDTGLAVHVGNTAAMTQ
jgi:hypothetical protein